jgi:hypothetical protein
VVAGLTTLGNVPAVIDEEIRAFCSSLCASQPEFIQSIPPFGAKQSFCFDNVARKIAKSGGSMCTGWAIWRNGTLYMEAEHHGVWLNAAGKMIDVSPQMDTVGRILFLPDTAATYDPLKPRANRFAPASATPEASEFADLAQERADILNAYHRNGPGEVIINEMDAVRLAQIVERLTAILMCQ